MVEAVAGRKINIPPAWNFNAVTRSTYRAVTLTAGMLPVFYVSFYVYMV